MSDIVSLEKSPQKSNKKIPNLEAEWKKTHFAQERARFSGFFEEPDEGSKNGYFQGRPIIGRDTLINGGVYLGAGKREAIVVDDKKGRYLDKIYQDLWSITQRYRDRGTFDSEIIEAVYHHVKRNLPFNEWKAESIASNFSGDQKVSLDVFIQNDAGVCRHQALLAGYLLERLVKEAKLKGKVSVDRNSIPRRGGHAWVRFTDNKDEVYIIDPAQDYAGKLKDIKEDDGRWFYERPGDLKSF